VLTSRGPRRAGHVNLTLSRVIHPSYAPERLSPRESSRAASRIYGRRGRNINLL